MPWVKETHNPFFEMTYGVGCAAWGTKIIANGGTEASAAKVAWYDTATQIWEALPDVPAPDISDDAITEPELFWPNHRLVVIGDYLYRIGGDQFFFVWRLDLTNPVAWEHDKAWTHVTGDLDGSGKRIPHIMDSNVGIDTDGDRYIYVWGEANVNAYHFRLCRLDTQTMEWEILPEVPVPPLTSGDVNFEGEPRFTSERFELAVVGGKVYVCEGRWSFGSSELKAHITFDIASLSWDTDSLTFPIVDGYDYSWMKEAGVAVDPTGRFIYYVAPGGGGTGPSPDPDYQRAALVFDRLGLVWGRLDYFPDGSGDQEYAEPYGNAAVFVGDALYAVGGVGGFDFPAPEDENRQVWRYDFPPPGPQGSRSFGHADLAEGDPAHVFATPKGGGANPPLSDWRSLERANGGLIGATARCRQRDVEDASQVMRENAIWRTTERQTGRVLFDGRLNPPGHTGGVVDLRADGVGAIYGNQDVKTLLLASDDYSLWGVLGAGGDGGPPTDSPIGNPTNIGLGVHAMGTYRYVVTFVTDDGETHPGPETSVTVGPDDELADIRLKDIPTGSAGVSGRRLYRNDPGMAAQEFHRVTTISDNSTEVFVDDVASVSANPEPPHPLVPAGATAIVEEEALHVSIEGGTFVYTDQRIGFPWHVRDADVSRVRFVIEQTREAANWECHVSASRNRGGPWSIQETIDLAGAQSKAADAKDFTIQEVDAVRIVFKRKSDGADAAPLGLTIRKLRVYGEAEDDDYTTSQAIRAVCAYVGISDANVKPTAVPALPGLFRDVPASAILDLMVLMTGHYRWLIHVDEDATVMDAAPYSRRRWVLADPQLAPDLPSMPRYSRAVVLGPSGRQLAEAKAEDPPPWRATAPPVRAPFPISTEIAEVLAQAVANRLSQPRWTGQIPFTRVVNENGMPVAHFRVRAGDQILIPKLGAYVDIDELERQEKLSVARLPETRTLIERFFARLELARTASR